MTIHNLLDKYNQRLRTTYKNMAPSYERELNLAIGNCKTLLDVGCGYPSPIKSFSKRLNSTGVDIFGPSINKSKAEGIHNNYVQIDSLDIDKNFTPNSYECVLASDLIEHLTKEDGLILLKKMETIASKKVVVFTPNGFVPQKAYENNPWQEHKSGWSYEEMTSLGYKIIGINGYKSFRGELSIVKFRPRFIWRMISDLTQIYTKSHPKKAFQLLCVKSFNDKQS